MYNINNYIYNIIYYNIYTILYRSNIITNSIRALKMVHIKKSKKVIYAQYKNSENIEK